MLKQVFLLDVFFLDKSYTKYESTEIDRLSHRPWEVNSLEFTEDVLYVPIVWFFMQWIFFIDHNAKLILFSVESRFLIDIQ